MAALYTPQPLLPVLATEFGVGEARASLLISVAMLPLAIAPIAYGFLLQRVSARHLRCPFSVIQGDIAKYYSAYSC